MLRVGPGAARAIEPVRLVHAEETASLFYDSLLTADGFCHSFQGAPPRRRTFVLAYTRNIVFAHSALHSRGTIRRVMLPDWTFPSEIIRRRRERRRPSQV